MQTIKSPFKEENFLNYDYDNNNKPRKEAKKKYKKKYVSSKNRKRSGIEAKVNKYSLS